MEEDLCTLRASFLDTQTEGCRDFIEITDKDPKSLKSIVTIGLKSGITCITRAIIAIVDSNCSQTSKSSPAKNQNQNDYHCVL